MSVSEDMRREAAAYSSATPSSDTNVIDDGDTAPEQDAVPL